MTASEGINGVRDAVIVTGASGRLGQVVVRKLSEAGYRPVRWVRALPDEGAGLSADGRGEAPSDPSVVCNVSDEGSIDRAFHATLNLAGAPRAVVHTVGAWEASPVSGHSLDLWQRMLTLNLTTAFLVLRASLDYLAPGGSFIAFAARQGVDGGVDGQAAYSAAKGGLVRLIEAAKEEAERRSCSVHAIAPSTILFDRDLNAGASGVTAEDIASLVVDLVGASDGALNGAVLRAYGRP